jgi:ABC-type multidrug transport system fused ATPase/permease subunit
MGRTVAVPGAAPARRVWNSVIERSIFGFIWKYSKRDQLILLVVTSALFPLLYLTLELPKRIINDAIGSQTATIDVLGMQIGQVTFLGLLCGAFLVSVLLHGLLKMRINTMKGVLSERMLRRLRYQLIARILRFPQPYFERVSQGELVSMVTAESEPMGGLMGDAISQPVLQAGQMLTILTFLFLQSVWFGLAAVALIPLQAWLIPMLQRQINLLNKTRIHEVRVLASTIGESAAGAATLRSHGGWRYRLAQITDQLGRLYEIRFEIYQKKFFMKFLNNFISQLTPFFFFSVGGYLVLQGSVSLGALVAALAAYKDLSSPWKELLTFYNQTQDMSTRWEVLLERFAPSGMIDADLIEGAPDEIPHLTGDIVLDKVSVRDGDGNDVLEEVSVTIPAGAVVAISAPSAEDRRAFAELLVREVIPASGRVTIGEHDLSKLHQAVIAARIGYATSQPVLFQGTFGDNVMMPVRARPGSAASESAALREAVRAGNSADPLEGDWITPSIAGLDDPDALRDWWLRLVDGMGSGTTLFRKGLEQRFVNNMPDELMQRIVSLRPVVQQALRDAGLRQHVFFIRSDMYNPGLPLAENLTLATPRRPITREILAEQTGFIAQLRALKLDRDIAGLSRDVILLLRQTFGVDGTDHPLFDKLGLDPGTYEAALALLGRLDKGGLSGLSDNEIATLLMVPSLITAEKIGPAFPEDMKARVLELRKSHAGDLQRGLGELFVPLDAETYAPGLSVQDNALFGKLSDTAGVAAEEVRALVAQVLLDHGLRGQIVDLIYDLPISLGGSNLPRQFAEPLALSRATIKRPDILIMDKALASYDLETRISVHKRLRSLLPDTTLIYLDESFARESVFDAYFDLEQGRIVTEDTGVAGAGDSAAGADLARKLRALERADLFSGLSRKQLRLLAFGARWYEVSAGQMVFQKGDAPTDGAYVLLEGRADLILPGSDGDPDELITTVGPGALVGELGLIRNEPRALTMVATSDLRALRLGKEQFLDVVEHDAATAFRLLQVVAGYVKN